MKPHKTLVFENVSELNHRFTSYLETMSGEHNILTRVLYMEQNDIIKAMIDPEVKILCLESTFADKDQLMSILTILNLMRDKITFREIRIMFSTGQFEVWLNQLTTSRPKFMAPMKELFDHYAVYSIERGEYENAGTEVPDDSDVRFHNKPLFSKIIYDFDLVKVRCIDLGGDDYAFSYERSPVIDPRKNMRKNALVEFDRTLLESPSLVELFNELEHMLADQSDSIEAYKSEDYEELKRSNANKQALLNWIKCSMKCPIK
jgi:hypothetical protein